MMRRLKEGKMLSTADLLQSTADLFQKKERKKRDRPIDHEDYIVIKMYVLENMARLFIDNGDGTFTYRRGLDDLAVAKELKGTIPHITPLNVAFVRRKQKPPIKLRMPNGQSKRKAGVKGPGIKQRLSILEHRIHELEMRIGEKAQ
jgi:hypothetical protein